MTNLTPFYSLPIKYGFVPAASLASIPINWLSAPAIRELVLSPLGQALLHRLHDVLLPYREGHCDVAVQYVGSEAAARLNLGPEWSVRPSRELRDKLTELLGQDSVRLLYAPGREMR